MYAAGILVAACSVQNDQKEIEMNTEIPLYRSLSLSLCLFSSILAAASIITYLVMAGTANMIPSLHRWDSISSVELLLVWWQVDAYTVQLNE